MAAQLGVDLGPARPAPRPGVGPSVDQLVGRQGQEVGELVAGASSPISLLAGVVVARSARSHFPAQPLGLLGEDLAHQLRGDRLAGVPAPPRCAPTARSASGEISAVAASSIRLWMATAPLPESQTAM